MMIKKCVLLILFVTGTVVLFAQHKIVVAQDGSGDHTTIQAAIDGLADSNTVTQTIFIKKGTYKEVITISKGKGAIRFIGESVENTKITFDNYSSKKDSKGKQYGTTGSATVFVNGDDISFENIIFENASGPVGQAVAINIRGQRVAFKNCRFLGFQDTLYTKGDTWQYFYNCYIEGTVDFVFGAATAVFENCILHSKSTSGYVTAASTPESTAFGYVFIRCKLTAEEGTPPGSVYLGRPWRPYAKTVFIESVMGKHIKPEGWNNWGKTDNEKTTFYAEYKSSGPGANPGQRVPWSHQLTAEQAKQYHFAAIFKDWKPF